MTFAASYRQIYTEGQKNLILLLLAGSSVCFGFLHNNKPHKPKFNGILLARKEGYDAHTGKWINKKPGPSFFSISPEVYEMVKNWYATDSGTNNPNNLPIMAPKEGFTYIYTPYKDKAHPNIHGMSIQGQNGYKGYWYADDLTKATDSSNDLGEAVPLPPPKDDSPKEIEYGGYDARTGNWVHGEPSDDAFTISQGTYIRVKNWYATQFNTNNPLALPVEVPKEDFTYLYVPYKDPKHPGVIGMSFQGDAACKGYWYADKIGETKDTIMAGGNNNASQSQSAQPPAQNPPPVQSTTPANNPPQVNNPTIQNQQTQPPVVAPTSEGNQPK